MANWRDFYFENSSNEDQENTIRENSEAVRLARQILPDIVSSISQGGGVYYTPYSDFGRKVEYHSAEILKEITRLAPGIPLSVSSFNFYSESQCIFYNNGTGWPKTPRSSISQKIWTVTSYIPGFNAVLLPYFDA